MQNRASTPVSVLRVQMLLQECGTGVPYRHGDWTIIGAVYRFSCS